jgi:ABC-2 type transport system permease protein
VLLTLAPLSGWVAAALGLVLGTRVAPQNVSYLFALVVLPLTFLGAIYYPWSTLDAVRWLQILVLINPLVYMCEGFRAALTSGVPHMSLWAVYGALALFAVVLTWIGIEGFTRRVTS